MQHLHREGASGKSHSFWNSVRVYIVSCWLLCLLILSQCHDNSNITRGTDSNLLDHPIYRKYKFDKSAGVINLGIQPLWIPPSLISEALKRDQILIRSLKRLGVQIRFFSFFKGSDINFFINEGLLDAGIGGDMPALTAIESADVIVTALVQMGFCSIVSKKPILMSELKGKRIGYAYGSNAHFALMECLSETDINPSQVQMISLEVNQMPLALEEGEIDAFSAWEPTPTVGKNQFNAQFVIHRRLTTGYLYFNPSIATDQSGITHILTAAVIRAINWLRMDKGNILEASIWNLDAIRRFSGETIGLNIDQIVDLALKDIIGIPGIPVISERSLDEGGSLFREFNFLKVMNYIPESKSWNDTKDNFNQNIIHEIALFPEKYLLHQYHYEAGDSNGRKSKYPN